MRQGQRDDFRRGSRYPAQAFGTLAIPKIDARNIPDGDVFSIQASDVTISRLVVVNSPTNKADIAVVSGHDARIAYNLLGRGGNSGPLNTWQCDVVDSPPL